jgi:phosphatidate cytidylyltransferase
MKNLTLRILTALVLLPIVILAFLENGLFLALLLMAASLIACLEASSIVGKDKSYFIWGFLFWAGLFLPHLFINNLSIILLCSMFMLVFFNALVLFRTQINKTQFEKMGAIFFWCFYISFGIASAFWLTSNLKQGLSLIIMACICTWANDTFAYFGGRLFGKHYLFPSVSQKKTWEGFISGSIFSILIALLFKFIPEYFDNRFLDLSYQDILWISIPSIVLAPLGDLIESRFKRIYDKKDSSQILPGHGGLLDRIDSLLLVIPWTALYAFIIKAL